jgi:hypothetical protein
LLILCCLNNHLLCRDAGILSDDDEFADFPVVPSRSPLPSHSAHNSPKQFPSALAWEGGFVALSPEQRAIWEQTPPSRYGAGKTYGGGVFGTAPAGGAGLGAGAGMSASAMSGTAAGGLARSRTGSRSNLAAAGAVTAPTHTTPGTTRRKVPNSTVVDTEFSESGSHSAPHSPANPRRSSSAVEASASSERSASQSPTERMFTTAQGYSTAATASGGRSLHDKLSSPDRKRAISPTEALRRYEERLSQAESNRDQTLAERVQKAHIASERVAAREAREAARKAAVMQTIEAKQKNVEERRSAFLRSIQTRALNESTKVQEVSFIHALNKEAIAQRLEEVETRILAASARR